jgi:hypothetical protein
MRNRHRSSRCGIGRAAAIAAKLDFRSREIRSASAFAIVRFVEKIPDHLLTSSPYAGAFDDAPSGLLPTYELWLNRRERWLRPIEGAEQHIGNRS